MTPPLSCVCQVTVHVKGVVDGGEVVLSQLRVEDLDFFRTFVCKSCSVLLSINQTQLLNILRVK